MGSQGWRHLWAGAATRRFWRAASVARCPHKRGRKRASRPASAPLVARAGQSSVLTDRVPWSSLILAACWPRVGCHNNQRRREHERTTPTADP